MFDALNDLGATPWIINRPMLENVKTVFGYSDDTSKTELLKTLSVPIHPNTVQIPEFDATFGENANVVDIPIEKWRSFSKKAFEAEKTK